MVGANHASNNWPLKNNFLPVNHPIHKIVRVLLLLFTSEFSKGSLMLQYHILYKTWKMLFVALQRSTKNLTIFYFAHAVSVCCSLTLLFSGILHNVAVLL